MKALAAILCLTASCGGTANSTMSMAPGAFECPRSMPVAESPLCIGPPARPCAQRLCKDEDGIVSWVTSGEETEEQSTARYWNILRRREEQQRWEQE